MSSTEPRGRYLSANAHRQLIGVLGLLLPSILVVIAWAFPNVEANRWRVQDSISAYYYTSAIAAFVGLLVALALFLLTYEGYPDSKYHWADKIAARIAGVAAIGVAFIPTLAPSDVPTLPWWKPIMGILHFVSATILFTMFAVFSLWLFRQTTPGSAPPDDKVWRNRIYTVSGIVIVACMAWTVVARLNGGSIYAPESWALIAFAASWLVKGGTITMIAEKVRKKR